MKKFIYKLLIVLLLPIIPFMTFTNSQYFDLENPQNFLQASSLDLQLQNQEEEEIIEDFFAVNKLKTKHDIEQTVTVKKIGSFDFVYIPKFEYKSGSVDVCSTLIIKAEVDGDETYNGLLKDFDLKDSPVMIGGDKDEWKLTIKHENEDVDLQGESCEFDLVFDAYQNQAQTGFSDSEKITNNIGLAYEPTLSVSYNSLTHQFIFILNNLVKFNEFEYALDYDTDSISDHVEDSVFLSGENSKTINIDLGTESDGILVPHINPHNFMLDLDLTDIDGDHINLSENL